jgi:hypothetical protein
MISNGEARFTNDRTLLTPNRFSTAPSTPETSPFGVYLARSPVVMSPIGSTSQTVLSSRWLALRGQCIWSGLNAKDAVLFVPELGKSQIGRLSESIQAAQGPMLCQGMPRAE